MIRKKLVFSATLLFAASLTYPANASTVVLSFVGPGVSGTVDLTFGMAHDSTYADAFEVTGISGTFTDTNNSLNIVNAPIGSLVPITHDTPEPGNLLAPNDFSRFAVASGLPMDNGGFLTFDNLYWPGGSPPTATDYQVHGGFLDIYGLMFNIGGGKVVDFWSNGDFSGTGHGPINYGIAVATHDTALDYVGGVSVTPEPNALILVGGGLAGLLAWRRRAQRTSSRQS